MNAWFVAGGLLALILAALSAVISAVKTALFTIMQAPGLMMTSSRSRPLQNLLCDVQKAQDALLLGCMMANLPLVLVCYVLSQHEVIDAAIPDWVVLFAILTVIILLCELAPKTVGVARPMWTANFGAPLTCFLVRILDPFSRSLRHLCNRIALRILPGRPDVEEHLSHEELLTMIELAAEEKVLGEDERAILQQLLKLSDKTAKHCMTPRIDAFTIPDDLGDAEAIQEIQQKRYHRVPVRGENSDDILGILDVKDYLLNRRSHYTEVLQPPSFIPETMHASTLLSSFLIRRQHFAILLDEFGGIEGIVTLSDLMEEILGEEGPGTQRQLYIERISENRILASGSAQLDDLSDELGEDVQKDGVQTVNGLVVEKLGILPRPGAVVELNDWKMTVRRATRTRVKEVLIERLKPVQESEESLPV